MNEKTNTGLVTYAKSFVGKPYWYGCYGQKSTESLYKQQKAIYPTYYTASDFSSQYGEKVHDCSGLIKGYLWSMTTDGVPSYDAAQDYNAQMFYNSSSDSGSISTIPEIPGLLVFKGSKSKITHVGVYGADGYVYEAKSHSAGVCKSTFSASNWNYWGKCCFLAYDITATDSNTNEKSTCNVTAGFSPTKYDKKYSKYYTVNTKTSGLNIRDGASTGTSILVTIPKGTQVRCWGFYEKPASGAIWLYVMFTYENVIYEGFATYDYLMEVD